MSSWSAIRRDSMRRRPWCCPASARLATACVACKRAALWEPLRAWLRGRARSSASASGYQMLFDESEESPGVRGFGFFAGKGAPFSRARAQSPADRLEQLDLAERRASALARACRRHRTSISSTPIFPSRRMNRIVTARAKYGETFAAAAARGNVAGRAVSPRKKPGRRAWRSCATSSPIKMPASLIEPGSQTSDFARPMSAAAHSQMILLPAIDLMSGEVVRLRQGKADQKTVYSERPGGLCAALGGGRRRLPAHRRSRCGLHRRAAQSRRGAGDHGGDRHSLRTRRRHAQRGRHRGRRSRRAWRASSSARAPRSRSSSCAEMARGIWQRADRRRHRREERHRLREGLDGDRPR